MEDYEQFVASRLSELRSPADPTSAPGRRCGHTSLIRFHGRCVLPPLLSGERREEMRALKEHLKEPSDRGGSAACGRVARVRHILHSVQLWKAPTLQEFFEEKSGLHPLSEAFSTSSSPPRETTEPLSSPPPLVGPGVPPLTSTTYRETSPRPPRPHPAGWAEDPRESLHPPPVPDPSADVSQQSQSSGYGTYGDAHNASIVSGRADWARESRLSGPAEGGTHLGGFFLCSPSNTTPKTPDIISHPPIDGEKLERSAMDSSIEDCLIANDLLSDRKQSVTGSLSAESGPPEDLLVTCLPLGTPPSAQGSYGQQEAGSGRGGPGPTGEAGTAASQPPAPGRYTTTDPPQGPGGSQGGGPADPLDHHADSRRSEEPYRLSLQALLKKSQECRQQQRALRNQRHKNQEVLERDREQSPEESLSDKENQEVLQKDRSPEEGLSDKENQEVLQKEPERRRTKHKGGDIQAEKLFNKWCKNEQNVSQVEDLPHKDPPDEFTTSHQTTGLSSTGLSSTGLSSTGLSSTGLSSTGLSSTGLSSTGVTNTETLDYGGRDKTIPVNIPPASSTQGAKPSTSGPVAELFAQTPPDVSAHAPTHRTPPRTEGVARGLSGPQRGRGYHVLPSPQLCTSPVHCRSKGLPEGGPDGTRDRERLVQTARSVDGGPGTGAQDDGQNNQWHPVAQLVRGGDAARWTLSSSAHTQQIDQLELNLSSLKLLISELESTITENMRNQDSSPPAGPCGLSPGQIHHQGPYVPPHGAHSLYGEGSPGLDSGWTRRPSLDNYSNTDEDTHAELWDFIDLPYIRPHQGGDGNHRSPAHTTESHPAPAGGLPLVSGGGGGSSTSVQGAPLVRGLVPVSRIPQPSAKRISSVAQRTLSTDVFREIQPVRVLSDGSQPVRVLSDSSNQPVRVLSDSSNQPVRVLSDSSNQPVRVLSDSSNQPVRKPVEEGDSLNRSYDVERPSGLWLLDASGSEAGWCVSHVPEREQLTPQGGGGAGGQGGVSKAKRRLLMHAKQQAAAEEEERRLDRQRAAGPLVGPLSYASTPSAPPPGRGASVAPGDEQQLKQAHAAQWRALQEEQGRQQQHLLQALSARSLLLQRVSSLCPPPAPRPGDAATLTGGGGAAGGGGGGGGGGVVLSEVCFQLPLPAAPPLQGVGGSPPGCWRSPPGCWRSLPGRWRPLLAAAVRGFLTRRLLRTARVEQLQRTARDTQQFLQAFEQQSGALCSRQDGLLWERVTLQLRSVRYELHDVFFRLTAAERMQLIGWDRELRRQSGPPGRVVGKSSLSAATQKSLERKRKVMMQQKAPDRARGPGVRAARGPPLRGPPTPQRRPGPLRTSRPQRASKTSRTSRR